MDYITGSSNNIEQAINRLTNQTGEITIKAKNVELVKKIWNQHKQILLNCK
jgi:hypothetical protein